MQQGGMGGEQAQPVQQGAPMGTVPIAPQVRGMEALPPEAVTRGGTVPNQAGLGASQGQPGGGAVLPR